MGEREKNTKERILEKEQCVVVKTIKEKGKLSLKIENEKGEPVYQGDDVPSGDFIVFADEAGNYNFIVSRKNAKGEVSFQVESNETTKFGKSEIK